MEKTNSCSVPSLLISDQLCFKTGPYRIQETQNALEYYTQEHSKYNDWEKIKADKTIAIFLDTNLLLDIYELSLKERKAFLDFIQKNKKRMFLTAQVETEFINHRFKAINALRKRIDTLSSSFVTKSTELRKCFDKQTKELDDFVRLSVIKNDMPKTYKIYEQMCKKIETLRIKDEKWTEYQELEDKFQQCLEEEKKNTITGEGMEYQDEILGTISQLSILDPLSEHEIDFLKKIYDNHLKAYKECKVEQERKTLLSFPGCGDRKKFEEEEKDPYGDFIIYHEMLKFMATEKRDIVFLTRDTSKSDWVDSRKNPFVHYIVNAYCNTHKMMFIVPAKGLFKNKNEETDDQPDNVVGDTEKSEVQKFLDSLETLASQLNGNAEMNE